MRAKLFRVLDRATELKCFGIAMWLDQYASRIEDVLNEEPILRAGGYGGVKCVLFGNIVGGSCWYDPYMWADRTYQAAHAYIRDNWDSLQSGATVDVEIILGEKEPK